jgi:hypothetical protein
MTDVYLEVAPKRSFAVAVDWPGWARWGKTPDAALEALADSAGRYAAVVGEIPDTNFDIAETIAGDTTTEFGAPGKVPAADHRPIGGEELERLITAWRACWNHFDEVAAVAPEELRKGPRGGGRDTSKVVDHVDGADRSYAATVRVRAKKLTTTELRLAMVEAVRTATDTKWPPRYLIRRSAWHALDHAWEIQDRSP